MKLFITPLIFVFSFMLPTMSLAGSIFDVDINGVSIGDSLLDHFDERQIRSWSTSDYSSVGKDKTFVILEGDAKFQNYDHLRFHVKPNDKNYTIYGVSAGKFFGKQNIELCLSLKKKVINDSTNKLMNAVPKEYESPYENLDDGKSKAHITDFVLEDGAIRYWCVDWSKETENKRNWGDNFQYNLSHQILLDWRNK